MFLGDGAHWLWELAALHFPEATLILPWYHLGESIHKASDAVCREGSQASRAWAVSQLAECWEGKHRLAREVVAALAKQVRSSAKREALRALVVYLKNNAERMD